MQDKSASVDRLKIPAYIHWRLVAWARWCRSPDAPQTVRCRSLESGYLPLAGEVFESVEALLRKGRPAVPEYPLVQIEVAVMRLPEKPREALRLDYLWHRQFPLAARCKMLGLGERDYWRVRYDAAMQIALQALDNLRN